MSLPHYHITGIKPVGEGPHLREEFSAWSKENDIQVSLFAQALTNFMEIKYTERLSYFQIAGPYKEQGTILS